MMNNVEVITWGAKGMTLRILPHDQPIILKVFAAHCWGDYCEIKVEEVNDES